MSGASYEISRLTRLKMWWRSRVSLPISKFVHRWCGRIGGHRWRDKRGGLFAGWQECSRCGWMKNRKPDDPTKVKPK